MLAFSRGSGPVLLRNPIAFDFPGGVRTLPPLSGSAHVVMLNLESIVAKLASSRISLIQLVSVADPTCLSILGIDFS